MTEDFKDQLKKVTRKTIDGAEKFAKKAAPKIEDAALSAGAAVYTAAETVSPHLKAAKDKLKHQIETGELQENIAEAAVKTAHSLEKFAKQAGKAIHEASENAKPHLSSMKEKIAKKAKEL